MLGQYPNSLAVNAITSGGQDAYCLRSGGVQVLKGLQRKRDVGPSRRKGCNRKNPADFPVRSHCPYKGQGILKGVTAWGQEEPGGAGPGRIHRPRYVFCSPTVCLGTGAQRPAAHWAHVAREVTGARNKSACSPETVLSQPGQARSSRRASQPSLGTWSSLSGRRWARAPRGPSPLPCAERAGPAEPWGPAASAPTRPQLRARSLQRLVRLVHSGSRPAHPPAVRRAWPHAGTPPRRGMGREERLEELETDTASASTVTAGDRRRREAEHSPPPATGGGTPPSAAAAPSPSSPAPPPGGCGPGPAGQAGECGWPCPPRAPPRPAGDPLRAGEEPPPPPPDRLRVPGKTRRTAPRSPPTRCAPPAAAAPHPAPLPRGQQGRWPRGPHCRRYPASAPEGRPQGAEDAGTGRSGNGTSASLRRRRGPEGAAQPRESSPDRRVPRRRVLEQFKLYICNITPLSPDWTIFKNSHQFSYSLKARGEAKQRAADQTILSSLRAAETRGGCWLSSAEEGLTLRWESRCQRDSFLCSWAHHGLHSLAGRLT
ncbi:PREDICTED: uncharacterized protein LOC101385927 [Odobenus rosmarus divergens]|uniref:Uncharacterized protein LOC101385927 n=1 Tax=Odobenus rosmarus divergens TaxID=9708 RepID=A0A9B0GYZ2_ODORO